jgi:hypothetical protein
MPYAAVNTLGLEFRTTKGPRTESSNYCRRTKQRDPTADAENTFVLSERSPVTSTPGKHLAAMNARVM